jgi:sulfite reductase (ferredoxin)
LRVLLTDYKTNAEEGETYLAYTERKGERYFYDILKPLTNLETLADEDFTDWGHEEKYSTAIGVGECAGVVIDLVATLILEGEEKLELSKECLNSKVWSDSIYHSYAAFVNTAKALLLGQGIQCNTQSGILRDFDTNFTQKGFFSEYGNFQDLVLQINKNEPSEAFALSYYQQAKDFIEQAKEQRSSLVAEEKAI